MFDKARWHLTLFFAAVFATILALIGVAVLSAARASLFDGVNDDLVARARELRPLADRILSGRPGQAEVPPALTAGGYFFALAGSDGQILLQSTNVDQEGLAGTDDLQRAIDQGPIFVDTQSSDGEDLRLYLRPLNPRAPRPVVLEIGRSTEPERQAFRRLAFILLGGGMAGLAMSVAGGYLLAGKALRPIKTAMDKQQQFVADASHELRTPLSLIRANAELLKRDAAKPVYANLQSVHDIISESDRLASLVSQLLTLARTDTGAITLQPEPVDLTILAQDVVRQMRLLASQKQVTLEAEAQPSVIVEGDDLRLRELLTILIDNAIKYSDAGARVDVSLAASRGNAVLKVQDTGRGIPREALPRIFERFYRADKARSRELGGSGLGLAIAKWIADTHHGTIRIDSTVARGTTVIVELPLLSTSQDADESAPSRLP